MEDKILDVSKDVQTGETVVREIIFENEPESETAENKT